MAKAIKVEALSKQYRLGQTGTGSFSHDINRFWHTIRGLEDPYLKIGEVNDRSEKSDNQYVWSLRDINIEIEEGDAVGIIGRNGAGKSTLLKILSLVTAPTSGSFKVKGRIASLLEVGTGFHPELTGRENIFLNGAILGMRKKEISRKFDEIVDFSGVERYIDTPIKRYSSGMYVRLAFAVAAHLESEILIVDEVLAVGDSEFQAKCLGKMGEITKGNGRTILFVSHNMPSILALCNKGILLDKGSVSFAGSINKTVQNYGALNARSKTSTYQGNGIVKEVRFGTAGNANKYQSEIKVDVLFDSHVPIKSLVVGFTIRDEFDVPVVGVNNRHYLERRLHAEEITKGRLEVFFKPLNLLPGVYKVDVFLGDSSIDIEVIEDAIRFEVEESIVNSTNHQIDLRINKIFMDNVEWRLHHD